MFFGPIFFPSEFRTLSTMPVAPDGRLSPDPQYTAQCWAHEDLMAGQLHLQDPHLGNF